VTSMQEIETGSFVRPNSCSMRRTASALDRLKLQTPVDVIALP
jgi:hypothetical protein